MQWWGHRVLYPRVWRYPRRHAERRESRWPQSHTTLYISGNHQVQVLEPFVNQLLQRCLLSCPRWKPLSKRLERGKQRWRVQQRFSFWYPWNKCDLKRSTCPSPDTHWDRHSFLPALCRPTTLPSVRSSNVSLLQFPRLSPLLFFSIHHSFFALDFDFKYVR